MLGKVLFLVTLIYLLDFGYGDICPHERHVVCNRNQKDHKCVCGVAEIADEPVPEKSCNLLLEIEDDEFDAVSVTFDLTEHNKKVSTRHTHDGDDNDDGDDDKEDSKKHSKHDKKNDSDENEEEEEDDDEDDDTERFPQEKFREELANALGADDDEIVIFRVGCNKEGDELKVQFGVLKKETVSRREQESREEDERRQKAQSKKAEKDDDDDDDNDKDGDGKDDNDDKDDGKNDDHDDKHDKSDEDNHDDNEDEEDEEFDKYDEDDFVNPDSIVRRLKEKGKDDEMVSIKVEKIEKVEKLVLLEGHYNNTHLMILATLCVIFCIMTCVCGCAKTFCSANEEDEHGPEFDKLNNV